MKIKIDKDGSLAIERNGVFRWQSCPFTLHHDHPLTSPLRGFQRDCGDWCPLFGEPDTVMSSNDLQITLCHTILFGQIIDERGKP